jgi:hypothetical protein
MFVAQCNEIRLCLALQTPLFEYFCFVQLIWTAFAPIRRWNAIQPIAALILGVIIQDKKDRN